MLGNCRIEIVYDDIDTVHVDEHRTKPRAARAANWCRRTYRRQPAGWASYINKRPIRDRACTAAPRRTEDQSNDQSISRARA